MILRLKLDRDSYKQGPRAVEDLNQTVEYYVDDIRDVVAKAKEHSRIVVLGQDDLVGGFNRDGYQILGMTIRYAMLHDVDIHIERQPKTTMDKLYDYIKKEEAAQKKAEEEASQAEGSGI